MYLISVELITYVIRYVIRSTDHEKDPNNPNVPSLRYINILKRP